MVTQLPDRTLTLRPWLLVFRSSQITATSIHPIASGSDRLTAPDPGLSDRMSELFFKNGSGLLHVAICAIVSYLALFIFIRLSGKRTMSKLNAFDFVVAVTLGSTLSSMILAKTPILEGLLAVSIIIGLQYLLAKLARESQTLEGLINSRPTLLFYNGSFLNDTLRRECITKEEIQAAVRAYRMEDMNLVRAVVMELNGELTVVKKGEPDGETSLADLERDQT